MGWNLPQLNCQEFPPWITQRQDPWHAWHTMTEMLRRTEACGRGRESSYCWNYEKIESKKWRWIPWHSVQSKWNYVYLRRNYTRWMKDRKKWTLLLFSKDYSFHGVGTYKWGRQQGRESIYSLFFAKNCRHTIWYTIYAHPNIVLAQDQGSKATNAICTFTPSKISFPSPENFLLNRAEHQARQINCGTKNINLTQGLFPHNLSLKWYWVYYFEMSTLFTTTSLRIVLFSRQIFLKLYSYSFHK